MSWLCIFPSQHCTFISSFNSHCIQMLIHTLLNIDIPSIGRCNINDLSQQTRMELLVANIHNLSKIHNADGDFLDISQWQGVELDNNGNVIEIGFESEQDYDLFDSAEETDTTDDCVIGPGGTPDLQWIPPEATHVRFQSLRLTGSIEAAALHRNLIDLNLSFNSLTGTIAWESLPRAMESLDLRYNDLEGQLQTGKLPQSMRYLSISSNRFSGSLDLRLLPEHIIVFEASRTNFSGRIDLSKLPSTMDRLSLNQNRFAQPTLTVGKISIERTRISLDKDKFGDIVDPEGKDVSDIIWYW